MERLRFPVDVDATALRARLAHDGIAVVSVDDFPAFLRLAELSPWRLAERLLGGTVLAAEQQSIRVVDGGRTFSSSNGEAPPHTDGQPFMGAPPDVQFMLCVEPAARGGENLFVDTWPMLERLERDDPALLDALFTVERRIPLVYGDHVGPTIAWRRGRVFFTHVTAAVDGDDVAAKLVEAVAREPVHAWTARAGDVLLIDNHRVLHARNAFDGDTRRFHRVLAWLDEGFGVHPRFGARARSLARDVVEPPGLRLRATLRMLRGEAPGLLSRELGVPERDLYAWREMALRGAADALESKSTGWLARWRRSARPS
jgi:hypothetical protein